MAENDIYNNKRKYDNFIKSMTKTKKRLSENQELILLLLGIPRGDKIRQFFKEHGEEINDENRKEFFNSIMIGNYTKKEVIDILRSSGFRLIKIKDKSNNSQTFHLIIKASK